MTLEELKSKLTIDYNDDDTDLQFYMDSAQSYIDVCCGEAYKAKPKLVKLSELALQKLTSDFYNNRSPNITIQIKRDMIINTIFDALGNEESTEGV
ncbi:hypothetical protein AGR56_09095 [Clostridium sp. DMHC 10]|uniref:head-tail connector protein n=1 Tax=Clostridium sp. DMHC 10 TaxID=747377 RepID=UPI00069F2B58|nr:head-tail connector protein [Clostridium sp. DMHC 10]KOF56810.1 hypothetical protein AGR56_09095 [Clostridium sp. DMHC 10]